MSIGSILAVADGTAFTDRTSNPVGGDIVYPIKRLCQSFLMFWLHGSHGVLRWQYAEVIHADFFVARFPQARFCLVSHNFLLSIFPIRQVALRDKDFLSRKCGLGTVCITVKKASPLLG